MKTTLSYKQQPVTGNYDAIVIGSGIGGLTTAGMLAREGKKVLVLEKHYTGGGFSHIFTRNDYEWDVGIHYVGEVHDPTSILATFFDYLSDGELKWADMGQVYDRVIFGDKEYEFVAGRENFAARMKEYFPAPDDQRAIDQYIAAIRAAARSASDYFMEKALPKLLAYTYGSFIRRPFLRFSDQTTLQFLQSITKNKELIGVLSAQYGDYGMQPSTGSFAIHAMVAKHYLKGGAYPVGGCARILETFAPGIEHAGGQIFTNADVTEILIKDDKAYGVKMKDGKEIHAPIIISNAGIVNTYGKLVPPPIAQQHGFKQILQKLKPSAAHMSLYIGLNHTAGELGLRKANYWIYPDNYDHDQVMQNYLDDDKKHPFPVVYISFPSAKDPDFSKRYPGKATIEIITFAPFEKFEQWDGTRWKKRGEEYNAMKEEVTQRLLKYLYKYEPQVEGKIAFTELSSPLTTKHFVNYGHGEIYGIEHTPERFRHRFLRPKSPIKGLFLTGQDIVSVGVGGALFSGILTASAILGKDLMTKILKANRKTA